MFSKLLKLSRKYAQKATSIFLVLYLTLSPLLSFPYEVFAAVPIINVAVPTGVGDIVNPQDIHGTATDADGNSDIVEVEVRFRQGTPEVGIANCNADYDQFTGEWEINMSTCNVTPPDGTYRIVVVVYDADDVNPSDGERVSISDVVVDSTAPVVDITSHEDGDVIGAGLINIAGTVTDTNLLRYYFVVKNSGGTVIAGPGTVNNSGPVVNPSFNWDTTAVAEGNYTVNLSARDLANNKEEPGVSGETITLTVDKTAGVTTLDTPSDNFSTNLPVHISGESTDANGVDYVALYSRAAGSLDPWILFETVDSLANETDFIWSYDWTPSEDGSYDIKASSVDIAGNVEASAYALNVTYDTTGPASPTPISPADGAAIRPVAFTQTWTSIGDAVEYRYQSCNVDPGDAGGVCSSQKFSSTQSGTSKSVGAGQPDSHFWWRVQAKDSLGNWGDYGEAYELIIDGTAPQDPSSFISSHAPDGYSSNNEITMEWPAVGEVGGASDALSGVDGYSYSFSMDSIETPDNVKDLEENELLVNSGVLSDGIWWFNIRTVDNAGNWTSTAHYGPVGIDTVIPEVSITYPLDNAILSGFTTYGTASDLTSEVETVSVDFKDGLGTVITSCLADYNSLLGEWNLDVNGISPCVVVDGVYDMEVRATDSAGNANSAEVLNITIDNTVPVVGGLNILPDYFPFVNGNLFVVTMPVSDATSGIDQATCEISYDGGLTWESAGFSNVLGARCVKVVTGVADGLNLDIIMKVADLAGNSSETGTSSRTTDSDDPLSETTISQTYYGPNTFMSDSINGTSSDSVSGVSQLKVSVRRSSDNKYWTESSFPSLKWINAVRRLDVSGLNPWTYSGITGLDLIDGVEYTVTPYARDEVNNPSAIGWATGISDTFIWDSSAPIDPSAFISSHAPGSYSNVNEIAIEWPAVDEVGGASDALSGVDGYSYSFSIGGSETPDEIKDLEENELNVNSGSLSDGEWWFNIRTVDNVGNWTSTEHYGPIYIDTVAPVINILTPLDGDISSVLDIGGTATDDYSDVAGVSLELVGSLNTSLCAADYNVSTDEWIVNQSTCLPVVSDDVYTVTATVNDNAGNSATDSVSNYTFDSTRPSDPSSFTSSHPLNTPISLNTISVDWPDVGVLGGAEDNLSGVAGYSYVFSNNPAETPDNVQDLAFDSTGAISTALPDGEWYFHLSTVDNAGNWTSTAHYGPMVVDTTAPVITVTGPLLITVTEGDTYLDQGAIAVDSYDGNITSNIIVNNNVDTDIPATYTVTYNVSDSAGNSAVEAQRTVVVQEAPAEPEVLGENEEEEEGEVLGLQCEVKQALTGYVYLDANKNGQFDDGEEGLEGVELDLIYTSDGEEVIVETVVTDENGRWKAEVCPGDYDVRLNEDTLEDDLGLDGENVLGVSVGEDHGEHNLNFDLVVQDDQKGSFDWRWVIIPLAGGLFVWLLYKFFTKATVGNLNSPTTTV